MSPEIAEFIGPVAALLGMGGTFLIFMRMRYNYLLHKGQGAGDAQVIEQLQESVERLHAEVQETREEFIELYERVEFAERLLARGKMEEEGPKASTPV